MVDSRDHHFMARALQLADKGRYTTDPNPRVGCVIVREGEVVGEGWHARAGEPHAEILALKQAGRQAREATAYVSLEPCAHHGRTPPCVQALIKAKVARVVAAVEDPNPEVSGKGLQRLEEAGIAIDVGVLEEQAERVNRGFISRMRRHRPFVRCKLAMSLDGRTAMASGESRWITGDDARRDVQRLRAESSAILTGIGTVLADDPALTVREELLGPSPDGKPWRQPLRVVVDPHLSTSPDAQILSAPGKTMLVTTSDDDRLAAALAKKAEVIRSQGSIDSIDLTALMRDLAALEVNEVLMETGATLSGAMLHEGLVDEIVIYLAPTLMGSEARGLFRLPGIERMDQRLALGITEVRAVGSDWRITARVHGPVTGAA